MDVVDLAWADLKTKSADLVRGAPCKSADLLPLRTCVKIQFADVCCTCEIIVSVSINSLVKSCAFVACSRQKEKQTTVMLRNLPVGCPS